MSLRLRQGRRVEKGPAVKTVWATSVLGQLGEEDDERASVSCSDRLCPNSNENLSMRKDVFLTRWCYSVDQAFPQGPSKFSLEQKADMPLGMLV